MTVEEFGDVVALWSVQEKSAGDVVLAACDLLVAGVDGPAVSRLAAASVREGFDMHVLEEALRELGLEHHDHGTEAGKEAGLRAMARRTLSGELTPRDLTRWVHRTCGHDRIALAAELALLDDVYDSLGVTALSEDDVDADVMAEVRRITR